MKQVIKEKKGFTLVELIVTFALTMIFTAACAMTITSYLNVYTKINDMSLCKALADTLEETIQGSLGAATNSPANINNEGDSLKSIIISANGENGNKVSYRNKDGYPMEIYCEDGKLVLHYLKLTSDQGGVQVTQGNEVHWSYQDGVYAGNQLKTVTFSHIDGGNIISAELTLENPVTSFTYVTKHAIECYNVAPADISQE